MEQYFPLDIPIYRTEILFLHPINQFLQTKLNNNTLLNFKVQINKLYFFSNCKYSA